MYSHIKKAITFFLLFISIQTVYADDIDILNQETLIDANVLFVMDLSGSMDWDLNYDSTPASGDPTRLDVLRGAFQDIVVDSAFDDINFGLSVFSGAAQSSGGAGVAHGITYPVSPVLGTNAQAILSKPGFVHPSTSYMPAAGTNNTRQYLSLLSADTNIWSADGSTPIVDALFEAARYFRGKEVLWGRYAADDIRSAHPSTYTGTLVAGTTTVTPACTIENRQSCNQGSCGSTESCTTSTVNETRSDPTGGTGCIVNTGLTCTTSSATCGLGSNCVPEINTVNRYCNSSISTVEDCQAANLDWESCTTYVTPECTSNSEGQSVCTDVTRVRCTEEVTQNRCDAADTHTCDFPVTSCTMCPGPTISGGILGTAVYKSPITEECPKNGIILLTDGAPTSNESAGDVTTMIGSSYANGCNTSPTDDGRCGPELADFLASEDHANGSTSVANIDGIQNVVTYTVGLSLDEGSSAASYLSDIATKGQGAFVNATNRTELTDAFKQAITNIVGKARSFSPPSYSVDTSTLLSHDDFVYIPVFDRSGKVWPGNLKKFKVIDGKLFDADGNLAVNSQGALLDSARDYWSTDVSTDAVTSGGAANKIIPATRNVKSDDGSSLISLNSSISNTEFGLSSSTVDTAYKDKLITYIKGKDPLTNVDRNHMGDIIHSKPVQLNIAGGRRIIFVGSNEGYLHAINDYDDVTDVKNGTEAFAYMPKELLPNIKKQYSTAVLPKHIYGVDSPITLWIDESYHGDYTNSDADTNKIGNGVLDDKEQAYLFFGLRRGGKLHYALNVTDPDNPVLAWSQSFGTGDSWSQPIVKNLIWGNNTKTKPVLVFGGGYNENLDGTEASGGNAVYIVDALTGVEIWNTQIAEANSSLAPESIANAVPSKIRALDVDRNGSIDRLYFGDTGGNIWRVDLNASNFGSSPDANNINKATLRKFAELGGPGANNRKFFEEPSIATFKYKGTLISAVAIGSGNRTKPLDATVEDKFFVLYDKEVTLKTATPSLNTIQLSDLSTAAVSPTTNILDTSYHGWVMSLTNTTGEKVLASPLIYKNKVLFSTFGTTSVIPDACNPSNQNQSTLYVVDLNTGYTLVDQPGETGIIPPTPTIVIPPPTGPAGGPCQQGDCKSQEWICVGHCSNPIDFSTVTDGVDPADVGNTRVPKSLERVYWIDNEG